MKELERKIEIQRKKIRRFEELIHIYTIEYLELLDVNENSSELKEITKKTNLINKQRDEEIDILIKYKQQLREIKLDA